jgi:hypothetical protein
VFVEQVLQVLSHLLAPGTCLHGRERLPEIGKALDRVSLMNELARELLDIFVSFGWASCFGIVADPRSFSFFLRTGLPQARAT